MTRLMLPPLLLALAGCATAPPSNPENICAIFREKPDWHDAALKVQKKWGAPVPVPMAMMYQESSFKQDAVPPRYYFLGIIPGAASAPPMATRRPRTKPGPTTRRTRAGGAPAATTSPTPWISWAGT